MMGNTLSFLDSTGSNTADMAFLMLIFVFMFATFGGMGYSENPFVWGSAMFIGVIGAVMGLAAGSGAAVILVPLALIVLFKGCLPALGNFVGEGLLAFFVIAFFIVLVGL